MNANELIVNAYYLSDIVSRELEKVSGSQQAAGLDMLNDLLVEQSAKAGKIPYYEHSSSTSTVKGQESYFILNLVDTDAVTYEFSNVRYSMRRANRKEYFGRSRANNIETLPTTYHVERSLGGSKLYFYPLPDDVYELDITGKFSLLKMSTGSQELSGSLDDFYVAYLKYALAERIAQFYNIEFAPGKVATLGRLDKQVFQVSPPDLKINKVSTLGVEGYSDNYVCSGLYAGFLPP